MTLVVSTLVSLDGVVESPWQWAMFDDAARQHSLDELASYDAFLLGRRAYDDLSRSWAPLSGDPYIDAINAMPKWIVTHRADDLGWNSRALTGDPISSIAALKEASVRLIKYGVSDVDTDLIRGRLVDRYDFIYSPTAVGAGRRLFENVDTTGLSLSLTDSLRFPNGAVKLHYETAYA
ncbi:dihydrofolate reductase family protein [Cryptosporangium phraense]|uniref:Dihydrofolate reductase n=1 Tax=Cryptosporangium phraense TaxID=2593070 RepID=A0A545AX40_9ACTN|nr:dihydrofolate reductase family protein [Cryptosporangium phraense]TQS45878.1 dihydrofolate reductase [Cryptosporangium phraense]